MNCRRIQSILSAYLDGELTGEEMLSIRRHLSACEYCSDELASLQIVKRLLGSLEVVNADETWSSSVAAEAYASNRPWWERPKVHDTFVVHFHKAFENGTLSPRGTRMVRALALSTVFIFLAAVPSSFERIDHSVTGRIADIGESILPWASNPGTNVQSIGTILQPDIGSRYMTQEPSEVSAAPRYDVQAASMISSFTQPTWSSGNGLTFVSSAHN